MYARSQKKDSPVVTQGQALQMNEFAKGVYVSCLQLYQFRNYPFLQLDLPIKSGQVVLSGKNGTGKTNLLEALSFLGPGKGIRQAGFRHIVTQNSAVPCWRVRAVIQKGNEKTRLGCGFEPSCVKNNEKRQIQINEVNGLSQQDLASFCSVIWLTPSMDRLFSDDPAARRRFLDRLTQVFFPKHASFSAAYGNALRQWGKLIREGKSDHNWLSALEATLGRYGSKIAVGRRKTVALLQKILDGQNNSFPQASLFLQGGWEEELANMSEEEGQDFIKKRFLSVRGLYAQNGSTKGVHTVDLCAIHREKQISASSCSSGEQKALLISVLLAQVRAQVERKDFLPLVLFDEAMTHLDQRRREALLDEISTLKTQVWLTGTDPEIFQNLKKTAYFIAVDELARNIPDWAAVS